MAAQDDLPTQEFLNDCDALVQMPEAENPDLYKRLRRLIASRHERRPGGYATGADVLTRLAPEERSLEDQRFGRALRAMFEKLQKEAAEFERMSESQKAELKAKANAEAEADRAFGEAWAAGLNALVDEYRKMKAGKT